MTSNLRALATYGKHQLPNTGDSKLSMNNKDHEGWLLCDGRSLDVYAFTALHNVIGNSYGNGTGPAGTTFNLPNPKGRVPGVSGAGPGLTARDQGDLVGQETVTLVEAELPALTKTTTTNGDHSHTHNANGANPGYGLMYRNGANTAASGLDGSANEPNLYQPPGALSIDSAGAHNHTVSFGSGLPHENMQPTIFVGHMFMYCGKPNVGTYPTTVKSYKVPRTM